jgi:tRNA modification GTPase
MRKSLQAVRSPRSTHRSGTNSRSLCPPRPRMQVALRTLYPPKEAGDEVCGHGHDLEAATTVMYETDATAVQEMPLDSAIVVTWKAPRSCVSSASISVRCIARVCAQTRSPDGAAVEVVFGVSPLSDMHPLPIIISVPRYTGEDMVELHLHGGSAVVTAVSSALGAMDGVRPAVPGEFTRRAFRNGKMDLTQVEGVHDLVAAETDAQRVQALRYVSAETTALYDSWRDELLHIMAHVEAFIDFGEDEGIEDDVMQQALARLATLRVTIANYVKGAGCGERLRHGVRIAVVGNPNVGKSSLMNYLCGREAAIVADSPGTTRDVIEVAGDVGGYPVVFLDTAGVRSGSGIDPVEVEGIRRAEAAASRADLRICVQDIAAGPAAVCLAAAVGGEAPCRCRESSGGDTGARTIIALNKTDLIGGSKILSARASSLSMSCKSRAGLPELVDRLRDEVRALCGAGESTRPLIQARHRSHLLDCIRGIDSVSPCPALPSTTTGHARIDGSATARSQWRRTLSTLSSTNLSFRLHPLGLNPSRLL